MLSVNAVDSDYPVTGFNGSKSFVIARETWVGPKNFFLPILYLVVGTFLILVSGFCKSFFFINSGFQKWKKNFASYMISNFWIDLKLILSSLKKWTKIQHWFFEIRESETMKNVSFQSLWFGYGKDTKKTKSNLIWIWIEIKWSFCRWLNCYLRGNKLRSPLWFTGWYFYF